MVTERHRRPLSSRVGGKDENPIAIGQWRPRVAHELIAVQVGNEGRMQPIRSDEFAKRRNLSRERTQQLPQSVRLHFQFGDAGTLAWNAKKLNMHNASAPTSMIA